MKAGANSACAMLPLLNGEQVPYQPEAASHGSVYSRFDQCVCVNIGQDTIRNVDAVIFDLDDTLYPEKSYVRSGFQVIASLLPQIDNVEEKLWNAFESGHPALDAVLKNARIEDAEIKENCLKRYREHIPSIQLYPDVLKLFSALRKAGKKIAILTDGRPTGQRNKIAALGLDELVDEILITDELGGTQFRKPNDVGFRILKYRLGFPFERIAYVGDNPGKDFHAPRLLGMPYVYFHNPDSLYSDDRDEPYTVNSVSELETLLC